MISALLLINAKLPPVPNATQVNDLL